MKSWLPVTGFHSPPEAGILLCVSPTRSSPFFRLEGGVEGERPGFLALRFAKRSFEFVWNKKLFLEART